MALILVAAYFIGSVPFALLLARRWGADDLRRIGSGNIGAANALRASGVRAGVLVAVLDIAKGAASVALAMRLSGDRGCHAAGFVAIVGHHQVWLRSKAASRPRAACSPF
jgi:glycerol-3-phosphate acyltransferase PlsY